MKPESDIKNDTEFKIKTLSHILLGEIWQKLTNNRTMLDELAKDVDDLMNAICVKEFSRNNKCDLRQFFDLINIRIQVLKALGDAEMKT